MNKSDDSVLWGQKFLADDIFNLIKHLGASLLGAGWQLLSGQPTGPIFKDHAVQIKNNSSWSL